MAEKQCPMIFAPCWGADCGWWDEANETCAVFTIATKAIRIEVSPPTWDLRPGEVSSDPVLGPEPDEGELTVHDGEPPDLGCDDSVLGDFPDNRPPDEGPECALRKAACAVIASRGTDGMSLTLRALENALGCDTLHKAAARVIGNWHHADGEDEALDALSSVLESGTLTVTDEDEDDPLRQEGPQ